jgi:hypothetical protein
MHPIGDGVIGCVLARGVQSLWVDVERVHRSRPQLGGGDGENARPTAVVDDGGAAE